MKQTTAAITIAMVGFLFINVAPYLFGGSNAYIAISAGVVVWLAGLGWYGVLWLRVRRQR
jgi:hypothetical protein